jgi:nicotinate phosphoribosyltransferase
MKLSAGKATLPGAKQAYRGAAGDILALRDEPPPAGIGRCCTPSCATASA